MNAVTNPRRGHTVIEMFLIDSEHPHIVIEMFLIDSEHPHTTVQVFLTDSESPHTTVQVSPESIEQGRQTEVVSTCPECGKRHRKLDALPDHQLPLSEIDRLNGSDSILYCGPTMINSSEETTPMVVLVSDSNTAVVASYFGSEGWLVTLEVDPDNPDAAPPGVEPDSDVDIDEEYGMLVNEMASQCIENGYKCVEQWIADGEPGGSVPN